MGKKKFNARSCAKFIKNPCGFYLFFVNKTTEIGQRLSHLKVNAHPPRKVTPVFYLTQVNYFTF